MICSRCHRDHDRAGQRYCLACHRQSMRDFRRRHEAQYQPRHFVPRETIDADELAAIGRAVADLGY